jgi:DNA/RNA-binding domain of Phe-tRNA-synthetase-like protein
LVSHFQDDIQNIFSDYVDYLSSYKVTENGENVIQVLEMLLNSEEDDLALAQLCMDSLNESFLKFFEEMKILGKINEFKDDYLY